MSDIYEKANELQKSIKEHKALLKEMEDEYYEIMMQIRRENITSVEFGIRPKRKPSMKAQAGWWKQNYPEFYVSHAHLSHPASVGLMTEICGGYEQFQAWMRNAKPDEFDAVATINMEDIKAFSTIEEIPMDELLEQGAVSQDIVKDDGYEIYRRPLFEVNKLKAESGENSA